MIKHNCYQCVTQNNCQQLMALILVQDRTCTSTSTCTGMHLIDCATLATVLLYNVLKQHLRAEWLCLGLKCYQTQVRVLWTRLCAQQTDCSILPMQMLHWSWDQLILRCTSLTNTGRFGKRYIEIYQPVSHVRYICESRYHFMRAEYPSATLT